MKEFTLQEQALTYFRATGLPIRIYDENQKLLIELGAPEKPFDSLDRFPIESSLNDETTYFNYLSDYEEYFLSLKIIEGKGLKFLIVVGPYKYKPLTSKEARNLLKENGQDVVILEMFKSYYQSLPVAIQDSSVSHYRTLELLFCSQNAVFNDIEQDLLPLEDFEKNIIEYREIDFYHHRYIEEQAILKSAFSNMDIEYLNVDDQRHFPGTGTVSTDSYRNSKNLRIVGIALFQRYAIEHGADSHTVFTIGDASIRKIENAKSIQDTDIVIQDAFRKFHRAIQESLRASFSKPIRESMIYINHHLSTGFKLGDVAEHAKVSSGHLSKLFRKELGMSFTDYVMLTKVDEAKRLLRHSNNSLTEISGILYFSSKSYFIHCFKKHTGLTPLEYRKHGEPQREVA